MTDSSSQTVSPQNWQNIQNNPNNNPIPQGQISQNSQNPQNQQVQQAPQNNLEQQKQQFLLQQEQIQGKYKQLKELYQGNALNIDQKQQVQEQMQKLSDLYTQNKQTLAMLATNISGEKQVQINKNVKVKEQKRWKKLSFSGIMIWCGVIFTLLVGWLAAVFYYLIKNPKRLASSGLEAASAAQLLQIFAIIFFGLLIFASLGLLIINIYRVITSKNKKKLPYILWVILWFVILIFTVVFGSKILWVFSSIDVDNSANSQLLVIPSCETIGSDSKVVYKERDQKYPLIAPVNVEYKLNSTLFNKEVAPRLWNVDIRAVSLDCGNWNILPINTQTAKFNWACMYSSKWTYPQKIVINYLNKDTSEQLSKEFSLWNLLVNSQINISTNQSTIVLSKNEIVLGKNPVKVTYDASEVYRDFQLSDYQIVWDADWDWIADKSDFTIYTHLYTWAGVYYVKVKYPKLNDHIYVFPVRVEQSDVPVAYIDYTEINKTEYSVSAQFYDVGPDISEYVFNILDKETNKIIDTISTKTPNINYTFPGNWMYAIQLVFVTQQWKQGIAESDNIEVWGSQFQIFYNISIKTPTKPTFQRIDSLPEIQVSEIPTILKIDITNIVPSLATSKTQVLVDGSPIISTNNSFQITIDENKDYNITIVVSEPNRNIKTEKEFKVTVKRDDIIWKLLVSPDTVWTSPFTVKFDASTTTINDSKDQIVYFSWDFGDGPVKADLSQAVINHTYNYDFENENWIFYPKVTIKTKRWRELTIGSGTMILVKKPNITLDINLDSHRTQQSRVWEKVDMSISVNWLPDKIVRDFGNWNTLECKSRAECGETSQIYTIPGEYTISVSVSYPDKPSIQWDVNLVVK